jgi:hypothetical protein
MTGNRNNYKMIFLIKQTGTSEASRKKDLLSVTPSKVGGGVSLRKLVESAKHLRLYGNRCMNGVHPRTPVRGFIFSSRQTLMNPRREVYYRVRG